MYLNLLLILRNDWGSIYLRNILLKERHLTVEYDNKINIFNPFL